MGRWVPPLPLERQQELFVTLTRKVAKPLPLKQAAEIVREYTSWTVVENTTPLLLEAITLQQKVKLSFWDALVVQAAIAAGCERLYTEDLNGGQRIGTLQMINPFARS